MKVRPTASVRTAPKRSTARAAGPIESVPMAAVSGRNASPVWIASYPSTRSRYSEPRKNAENMPVTSSPRTRLEPMSMRRRRTRSGMIGLEMRACSARNAASSTSEAPPAPSVRAEVRP